MGRLESGIDLLCATAVERKQTHKPWSNAARDGVRACSAGGNQMMAGIAPKNRIFVVEAFSAYTLPAQEGAHLSDKARPSKFYELLEFVSG